MEAQGGNAKATGMNEDGKTNTRTVLSIYSGTEFTPRRTKQGPSFTICEDGYAIRTRNYSGVVLHVHKAAQLPNAIKELSFTICKGYYRKIE
jgi:hypothetical protein